MSKINFVPLGNRVIIKELPISEEDKKINGIVVPENAIPHRCGIVAAVGGGEFAPATGSLMEMTVAVGDRVLYLAEAAFVPVRINNEEYKLMREIQIEAIIE